jgi:hypothetical protein
LNRLVALPSGISLRRHDAARQRDLLRSRADHCNLPDGNRTVLGIHDEPVASQKRNLEITTIPVQPLHRDSDNRRMWLNDGMPKGRKIDAATHGFIAIAYEII